MRFVADAHSGEAGPLPASAWFRHPVQKRSRGRRPRADLPGRRAHPAEPGPATARATRPDPQPWIPATRPREQLGYFVDRLDLYRQCRPFTRCTVCNGILSAVDKDADDLRLPPRVRAAFDTYWRCNGCSRVYWQGSHFMRLKEMVKQLSQADSRSRDELS